MVALHPIELALEGVERGADLAGSHTVSGFARSINGFPSGIIR